MRGRLRWCCSVRARSRTSVLAHVRWLPVSDPTKVLCVGLNYADHVAEGGRRLLSVPDVFSKFSSTLIGPEDDILCSEVTSAVATDRACDPVAGPIVVPSHRGHRDVHRASIGWRADGAHRERVTGLSVLTVSLTGRVERSVPPCSPGLRSRRGRAGSWVRAVTVGGRRR